jgi:hypothetical protein
MVDEEKKRADEDIKRYQDELSKPKIAAGEEHAKNVQATQDLPLTEKVEAGKGAARSGAEARAKLAPDIVAGQAAAAGQKSAAEAKVKEGKGADPEVEANRRMSRFNGAVTSYAKLNAPPTGWTGSRKDASTPEGRKWVAGLTTYLAAHDMGPNGELFEHTATGPNGQKKAYYDGAWHDI